MSNSEPHRVVVAEILRTRGLRGELVAKSLSDVPGRLQSLREANAHLSSGADVAVTLLDARRSKDEWVLQFAGVETIEQAEPFKGAELWVPVEERARLAVGEFFQSDLVGLQVLNTATAQPVGVVEDIAQYGGPPLLVLKVEGREVLIPFVPEICKVDLAAGVIQATLPDGLLEL